jgi:DNA-binding CsgD family transcriptional regulator
VTGRHVTDRPGGGGARRKVVSMMIAADVVRTPSVRLPSDEGGSAAVEALVAGRRLDDAAQMLRGALAADGRSTPETAHLHLALAWHTLMCGYPERALPEANLVLEQAGLDERMYAAANNAKLMALLACAQGAATQQPAEELFAGDASSGDDESLAAALMTVGCIAQNEGRIIDSLLFLRAAVARADRAGLRDRGMHPRQSLAASLAALGEFDEAELLLNRDRAEVEARGNHAWAIGARVSRSRLRLAQGRLAEAHADAEAAIRLADATGARLFIRLARVTVATVQLHQGDLRAAAAELDRCRHEPPVARGHVVAGLHAGIQSAINAAHHGDREVVETLAALYDDPSMQRRVLVKEPALAALMVRGALAAGHRAKAQAVVACTAQLAGDNANHRAIAAVALHTRGVLHGDPVAISQAARQHVDVWALASALEDAAVVFVASGDRERAHVSLESAIDVCERANATRLVARLHRKLGEARTRHSRTRLPSHAVSGWGSLTDTERRVAVEVVRGQTNGQVANRMFLSRHTVDFHLRQIFLKLGVHSRVDLTRLVIEVDGLAV